MIPHLRIGTKLLIFQLHIYVKITSVLLQLFKFIKSDFAANLEDYIEPSLQALFNRKLDFRTDVNSQKHFLV